MAIHTLPRLALVAFVLAPIVPAALASAPRARAQDCAEGRVSTAETAGRCCWPGQSWSEEHGRCSGPPACPSPLVAEGDRCVAPAAGTAGPVAGPSAGSYGAPQPIEALDLASVPEPPMAAERALRWPETPPDLSRALVDPRIVRGSDETLLLGGLMTFLGGYLTSIVFALVDEAAQNCMSFSSGFGGRSVGCSSWGFSFIPVAGGLVSGFTTFTSASFRTNVALAFAIQLPAAMVQILGLILTSIAAFGYTEDAVPAGRAGEIEVSFSPYATETEGGAWLELRF